MAKNDILIQIKDAEANAHSIIEDAKSKAHDNVVNARSKARSIIKDAEEEAIEHANNIIAAAEKDLAQKRAGLIMQGNADAKVTVDKANKNIASAVEFLVGDFERATHAGA